MLHFYWNKLDHIASEAVRAAINSRLSTLCDDTWHVSTSANAQQDINNEISASSPSVSASIEDVKSSTTTTTTTTNAKATKVKITSTPEEQSHSKEIHVSPNQQVCSSVVTTLKLENATSEHHNLQNEQLEELENAATSVKTTAITNNYAHDQKMNIIDANYNNSNNECKNMKRDKQVTDSCNSNNIMQLPNLTTKTPSLSTTPLLPKLPLSPHYTSHSFHEEHEEEELQQRQEWKHESYGKFKEQGKHTNLEESTKGIANGTKSLPIHTQTASKDLVSSPHVVMTSGARAGVGAAATSSTLCSQTSSPSAASVSATQHIIEPLSSSDTTKKDNANRLFHIDELQVTELSWGSSSPFIEIVEFSSALDYEPDLERELNVSTSQGKGTQNTQLEEDEATDRVAQWCGSDGLFIRFHLTYGGDMHLSLSVRVTYDIKFSSITLPVSLPVKAAVSGLDLDCFVCVNLYKSNCKIWLENTETSASPINRLKITTTFGSNDRVNVRRRPHPGHANVFDAKQLTVDKSVGLAETESSESTCKNVSHNVTCDESRFANKNSIDINNNNNYYENNVLNVMKNKSFEVDSLESNFIDSRDSFSEESTDEFDSDVDDDTNDDDEEESSCSVSSIDANNYDAVFTDEKVISQFILDELRALLREKLIAPHFMNIHIPPAEQQ